MKTLTWKDCRTVVIHACEAVARTYGYNCEAERDAQRALARVTSANVKCGDIVKMYYPVSATPMPAITTCPGTAVLQ
eukprot:790604-Pyramimonas_sp.AAC.1